MGTRAAYDELAALPAAGHTHFDRWPIFVVHDWQEAFVHLAAHEARHLVQAERRLPCRSEVDCEEFAMRMLLEYQQRKATGETD